MVPISCNSFDLETSKLAHVNDVHILLPTFPVGQIKKKKAQGSRSQCDVLGISFAMVSEMHANVPCDYSGHSQH